LCDLNKIVTYLLTVASNDPVFTAVLLNFFIITILKEHEAHFCSKFKNKLITIPASAEEQSLNFSI